MSSFRTERSGTVNGQCDLDKSSPIFSGSEGFCDCLVGYDDDKGKRIKGCKLSIFHEMGNVKVCIRDEHYQRQAFAVLDPSKGLGEALAEVLDQGGLEWRPMRGNR